MRGVPEGWVEVELGEVCEIRSGVGFPKRLQHHPQGDFPVFKVGDISRAWLSSQVHLSEPEHWLTQSETDQIRAKPFPAGSVVFAKIGAALALNRRAILSQPSIVDNNVMGLLPDRRAVCVEYLFHFMCTQRLGDLSRGGIVPSLRQGDLSALALLLAPLPEQRRIVAKIEELFSELDAGVTALERAQAKLERYRASVLKAAVEGRLTEQWRKENPPEETGEKLLKRILAERRQRWEEEQLAAFKAQGKTPPKGWREKYKEAEGPDTSGLPELPEGWCWVGLAQVASFQNGRAFPSNEYSASGVRLLRPGNLMADGRVVWREDNTRFMPTAWLERFPAYLVRGGELVMNLTAQSLKDEFLGRTSLTDEGEDCLLNQRLARITPLRLALPSFLLAVLKAERFRRFVDGLNKGSLIQHMFTRQLSQFFFPFPPIQEQEVIAKKAAEATETVSRTQCTVSAQIRRLELMRSAILKLAFEGRLVPQDPNDEPASVLLERIRASRKAEKPATKRPRKPKSRQGSLDL